MEKKTISLTYCAKIVPFEDINQQFTRCKCYVQALGKNRNLTHFYKENVQRALPTLFNIPVIGHILESPDGKKYMGGHDVEVVVSDDGSAEWRSICVPYGVVPQQDSVTFEWLKEPDGVMREYLSVDIILWTGRFPELKEAAYSDDFYFNQSMEIIATGWKPLDEDHNYLDVTDYTYSALCLLGKADDKSSKEHTEPCFPLASVQPYEYNVHSDDFIKMASQLREELASCFAQKESQKGGDTKHMPNEKIEAILSEYGLTAEQIGLEISDDLTEEGIRSAAEAYMENTPPFAETEPDTAEDVDITAAEESEDEPCEEEELDNSVEEDETAAHDESFSMTVRVVTQMMQEALNSLSVVETDDDGCWVSETCFYLADFDDKYVYAEMHEWTREGGEKHVVHCRFSYVLDEARKELRMSEDFDEMVVYWLTVAEAEEVDRKRGEYEELRQYKADKEEEEKRRSYCNVLEEFSDIANAEEFAQIRENPYRFASADDLRMACFAVRGMISQPKTKVAGDVRCPILTDSDDPSEPNDGRYGDLFSRFGHKNK